MAKENTTEYTKIEAKAIESYIADIYSKKVPEPSAPTRKELSFWNIAGIEAVLFTISGIGIAIYSAIRTGGLFYIMETLLLQKFNLPAFVINLFSYSAMVTSLISFELYVIADGFVKGKESGKLRRSQIGLYSSLGVLTLAGIFTGFGLIPNLDPTFELIFYIVVAIGTALAGSVVALYSGENIGFTVSKVDKTRKDLIEKHREDYQRWRESGVKAYNSSHYAIGSRKSTEFVKNLGEYEKVAIVNPIMEEIEEQPVPEDEKVPEDVYFVGIKPDGKHSEKFVIVYNSIIDFVKRNNRLPKKEELETLSKDKLQTYIAFSQFVVSNEAILLRLNLVSPEMVDKASKYLDANIGKKV